MTLIECSTGETIGGLLNATFGYEDPHSVCWLALTFTEMPSS